MTPAPASTPQVQRQIVLPLTKAIEIAYKSIRLRLSRTVVVTSGIVLALAFLMSILTSEAITGGMRAWSANPTGLEALESRRHAAQARADELRARVQDEFAAAATAAAPAGAKAPDFDRLYGMGATELQRHLGGFPVSIEQTEAVLTARPDLTALFGQWVQAAENLRQVKTLQTAPQQLQAMMKANGVPTTPEEIANNRIQTRWLLTLALLVAFVGILNAMLMAVTERFREIGTMKCLGALDGFIVKLFLLESLFQGIVGTLIGIVVGLTLSFASSWLTYGRFTFLNVPAGQIALSAAICLVVGVGLTVAGAVYPAWQAARMQPIEAMRVEA